MPVNFRGGHSHVSTGTFEIELHDAADRILTAADSFGWGRATRSLPVVAAIGKTEQISEGVLLKNWLARGTVR